MDDGEATVEAGAPERLRLLRVARAAPDSPELAPLRLGARVREIRRARNWTLEQAARRAGLARSTLSKIENEQMSPTFDAVQKLARGLGIAVPQLFTSASQNRIPGRRAITRAGRGAAHPTATYEHEILCGDVAAKKMLPYRTVIRARSFEDFSGWVRHDGEEFLLVLSGDVRFFSEFYAPLDLSEGDSAYYDANMGHCLVSLSAEDAQILWVTAH
ncbi:helix-turn-helix domain-containing protein [Rubrimonas cliftonensis]|uniref:Transcriptional regulator, XRE family with cupin sensor n=1 Tax=Rubrimonas cliftonensis TaxID=89524 RepID=A0A1H3W6Y3_9RHOB|nr:transcriptional regulator, XRE family with cupin sensor [Rubrimonas cliftonensis]